MSSLRAENSEMQLTAVQIQLMWYSTLLLFLITATLGQVKHWTTRRLSSQMLILNRYTAQGVFWCDSGCVGSDFNAVCQPGLWLCGALPECHWESEARICQSGTPTDDWSPFKAHCHCVRSLKGKSSSSQRRQVLFLWLWKVKEKEQKHLCDQNNCWSVSLWWWCPIWQRMGAMMVWWDVMWLVGACLEWTSKRISTLQYFFVVQSVNSTETSSENNSAAVTPTC